MCLLGKAGVMPTNLLVAVLADSISQSVVLVTVPRPFLHALANLTPPFSTVLVRSSRQLGGNSIPIVEAAMAH